MHQAKISSFFQPSCSKTKKQHQLPKVLESSDLFFDEVNVSSSIALSSNDSDLASKSDSDDSPLQHQHKHKSNINMSSFPSKNLSKKRIYEQYHLDLGQSDFVLHTCSVCGLMYARGVEEDEKVHKKFHQEYDRGIQFKGWHNERVVSGPLCSGDRILLILDIDPPAQKRVVQKVINLTKKELGFIDDQIIHALCKVFLFISAHRIVGWLVAEPIQTARRVIPSSSYSFDNKNAEITTKEKMDNTESDKTLGTTLQFGNIKFHRELAKKEQPTTRRKPNKWDGGAVVCDEKAVPAKCGVRAIWVVPSSRRKRIASQLMDAVRNNFSTGQILDISNCAFSPPTSAGMAFATDYTKTKSFLIYRSDDI